MTIVSNPQAHKMIKATAASPIFMVSDVRRRDISGVKTGIGHAGVVKEVPD
jgi:hypothetical protein